MTRNMKTCYYDNNFVVLVASMVFIFFYIANDHPQNVYVFHQTRPDPEANQYDSVDDKINNISIGLEADKIQINIETRTIHRRLATRYKRLTGNTEIDRQGDYLCFKTKKQLSYCVNITEDVEENIIMTLKILKSNMDNENGVNNSDNIHDTANETLNKQDLNFPHLAKDESDSVTESEHTENKSVDVSKLPNDIDSTSTEHASATIPRMAANKTIMVNLNPRKLAFPIFTRSFPNFNTNSNVSNENDKMSDIEVENKLNEGDVRENIETFREKVREQNENKLIKDSKYSNDFEKNMQSFWRGKGKTNEYQNTKNEHFAKTNAYKDGFHSTRYVDGRQSKTNRHVQTRFEELDAMFEESMKEMENMKVMQELKNPTNQPNKHTTRISDIPLDEMYDEKYQILAFIKRGYIKTESTTQHSVQYNRGRTKQVEPHVYTKSPRKQMEEEIKDRLYQNWLEHFHENDSSSGQSFDQTSKAYDKTNSQIDTEEYTSKLGVNIDRYEDDIPQVQTIPRPIGIPHYKHRPTSNDIKGNDRVKEDLSGEFVNTNKGYFQKSPRTWESWDNIYHIRQ